MIQTKIKEEDREVYLKYADNGIPCIFVVTDEKGEFVGTGTYSEEAYQTAINSGGDIVYTDRIILENVDKDTKKLYVKIYEPYYIAEGDTVKLNTMTLELDIEKARNYNKPVELTQSYTSKNVQVAIKYPVDWEVLEEENTLVVKGPEDIDGQYVEMNITLKEDEKTAQEIFEEKKNELGETNLETGTINIAGIEGYYYTIENTNNTIETQILFNNGNKLYNIQYTAIPTQYERHKDTIQKILDTIEFVEPEKSYVEYYMENNTETNLETVRVYEDNTVTVQITQRTIEMFKDSEYVKMQPNVEYEITGINSKILRIEFMGDMAGGAYQGSYVFIYDANNELYLLDMNRGITECEFEVTKIEIENRATNPEFKVISEESGLERPIVVVYNQAGQGYIISRDGSLEEYVEKQENDNQEQTTQQNTTDAKAKEVIQKYLSMSGTYEGEPAGMLTTELPDYITANLDLEDTFIENGISYVNTNASYDDFEREMTKYMSYEIFNQYFLKYKNHINPFRNVNGLLYVAQVAGSGAFYDVIEVERMNRNGNEYTYNAYANEIYGDITRKVTFSIKLVEIDGNMIVTYVGIG